jgi:Fe-S-cluster-containing hydrogenase component 2
LNPIEKNFVLERKGDAKRVPAVPVEETVAQDRVSNFQIYTRTYTYEDAVAEAGRCLNCGCGEGCLLCVDLCNSFAISNVDGKPAISEEECVGCGVCVWRCPSDNLVMIPAEG